MRKIDPQAVTDAVLVSSTVAAAEYPAWLVGTTYATGARVQVDAADVHLVFESVADANTGHAPLADTEGAWWVKVGATNQRRMFDGAVQSQTTAEGGLTVVMQYTGRIDAVPLLNLAAATGSVTIEDDVDSVTYDFDLVSTAGIIDWWSWFFIEPQRLTDVVIDVPAILNPTITVTLSAPGETVGCGLCLPGQAADFGGTQWGAQVGIRDYSRKDESEFGDVTIVQRAYARWAKFNVWVPPGYVDALVNELAAVRARPQVWVGDSDYGSTLVYGFYDDFTVDVSYPTISACSLSIKGLT